MVALSTVLRNTPAQALRRYFAARDVVLDVDWSLPLSKAVKPIIAAIEGLEDGTRSRVVNETQRIAAMADESGQTAIYNVIEGPAVLDGLANGYERAFWLYMNRLGDFRRAEEIRYTDERRRGRLWGGFVGEEGATFRRDEDAIAAFRRAVSERFQSKNVHVDIFDRVRSTLGGEELVLIQATVYSEGRREEYLEFVEGELDTRGRRPVIEAAMTYEPKTGVIEVVAKDREAREEYARILSRELLGMDFEDERIPLRRYDLAPLLQAHAFPADPEDGIDSVRVASLRLMPIDDNSQRVTLECADRKGPTIWEMGEKRFGDRNPLNGGWIATEARIVVRFHARSGVPQGKVLPVTITMPTGCDLKDRTEFERLVGEKYLHRWRLVESV